MTLSNPPPVTKIPFFHPAVLIATSGGVGYIPVAPGTFGSLVALPLAYLLWLTTPSLLEPYMLFYGLGIVALLYLAGSWACYIYSKTTYSYDPKEVVIDEVAGQLLTLVLIYPALKGIFLSESPILIGNSLLLSFLLFRFFDIAKPGLIGWVDEQIMGPNGVMLDDVFAGLFAAITFYLSAGICYLLIY